MLNFMLIPNFLKLVQKNVLKKFVRQKRLQKVQNPAKTKNSSFLAGNFPSEHFSDPISTNLE